VSWAAIDDNAPNHPKLTRVSVPARWLFVCGLCYSTRNLTDGVLDARALRVVTAEAEARPKHVTELHEVGLWDRLADGYLIHDFDHFNPKADEVRERRRKRAEAGRLGGLKSGEARRSKTEANASKQEPKQNGKHRGSTPSPPLEDQRTLGEQGLFRVPAVRTQAAS
jgi:hypothetical protein